MRSILLILLFLVIKPCFSKADCASNGFSFYPEGKELNLDAYIIIEAYGTSQEIIADFNIKYHPRLKTKDHCVNLEIIEIIKGQFNLTQIVMHGEQLLREGATYVLQIDSMPSYLGYFSKYNVYTKGYEGPVWKAVKYKDTVSFINKKPKFLSSDQEFFGCGPSMHALFEIDFSGRKDATIKAQLRPVDDELNVREFYLRLDSTHTVQVGHGMCSGGFKFIPKQKYQVRFCTFGFAQKPKDEWTDWVSFKTPNKGF